MFKVRLVQTWGCVSHEVSCRKCQDLQIKYKITRNNGGSRKRWEMPGKKESKRAPTASANRFMASPTCFWNPVLCRALSCCLQLPDHITLWPQSHFIAVTSSGEVVSGLTEDLHFTALLNTCKEAEGQWQSLGKDHSHCGSWDIFMQKWRANTTPKWVEDLD